MAYQVNESINIALKISWRRNFSVSRAAARRGWRAASARHRAACANAQSAGIALSRAHRGARALIGVGVVMARRRVKRRKSIKWHGVMKLAVSWRHQRGENISKISASIIISGVAA
jgi:hypothetical protein